MQGESPPTGKWRPNAWWVALALYLALVSLGSNLLELRYSYVNPGLAGSWGMTFRPDGGDVIVQSVQPHSNEAALGLKSGDRLGSDEPFTFRLIPRAGETLRFARISPGSPEPMQIVAPRAEHPVMATPNLFDRILDDTARLLLTVGGLLILWRGSRRRSGFILGLALLSMSPFPPVFLPLSPYESYFGNVAFFSLINLQFGFLMPFFARAFLTEANVPVPPWARPLSWLGAVATLAAYILIWVIPAGVISDTWPAVADEGRMAVGLAMFVLTCALLSLGLRRGPAESRHRFALLLLAIGLIYFSNMLYSLFNNFWQSNPRLLTNAATTGRALGTLLFVYAVLRHRVIDVGFTLNRTLVYGGVSAILLAASGLAEWGLHQIFALEGWEGSAMLSAALAVAIVVAFHPVRQLVEHYVSTTFFRPWRIKEQALRKFVHEGGFFADAAQLAAAFAGALEKFTGGSCCVYRHAREQSFVCAAGTMPAVGSDDAVAVALRAHGTVCRIQPGETQVQGVLAFPMIHAHDLEGFAVLGPKANGELYRPDEMELVDWATKQIGQDLYRLDVEQLKRERLERDREIAILTARNADLQLALANRSSTARPRRSAVKGAAA
jgi:hypothetical protein